MLLVIGGQAPKAIRSVECYDFKDEKWCNVADMPSRRCRCGENLRKRFCEYATSERTAQYSWLHGTVDLNHY